MKKFSALVFLLAIFSLTSCENYLTRKWGGNMDITVPKNYVVKSCSWKDGDQSLWVLYRDTLNNTDVYRQYSQFGKIQGSVTFHDFKQ